MSLFFANFFGWIFAHKKLTALALIILIVGGYIFYLRSGWKNSEKRAAEAISTENQIRVNEAGKNVNIAANQTNQSIKNVKKTENANFNNTNLTDANRLRCQTFPERCR